MGWAAGCKVLWLGDFGREKTCAAASLIRARAFFSMTESGLEYAGKEEPALESGVPGPLALLKQAKSSISIVLR
jgi:hypothetical protein